MALMQAHSIELRVTRTYQGRYRSALSAAIMGVFRQAGATALTRVLVMPPTDSDVTSFRSHSWTTVSRRHIPHGIGHALSGRDARPARYGRRCSRRHETPRPNSDIRSILP